MKNRSQAGFTLVEILLVIITLTLVSLAGYYVYSTKNDKNTDDNKTVVVKSDSDKSTAKYLTVSQLGIKLKLNDSIAKVEYLPPDNIEGGPKSVYFTDEAFTEAVKACRSGQATFEKPVVIATVTRYEGKYNKSSAPENVFDEVVQQFPDFYLTYGNPDGGYCDGSDQAKNDTTQELFTKINDSLKASVKNAQEN